MKLIEIKKVRNGNYLKNYELKYINKAGREKIFDMVSYQDINNEQELGASLSGIAIVGICDHKLLLLHEFRMGVNCFVYNLCAGRIENGESLEDCVRRELYEETGLELVKIIDILPPSYAAVALSDVSNQLVYAEVKGNISSEHLSDNEQITAGFYNKSEVEYLIKNEKFSSRAQSVAYSFIHGVFD